MSTIKDNMMEIPLFPLNTTLFPGMPIHLRIFEDRYRLMILNCLEKEQTFGVVLLRQGSEVAQKGTENIVTPTEPYLVGCTTHIIKLDVQDNGHINLTAVGDERFRITTLNREKPYLTAHIEMLPFNLPPSAANYLSVEKIRSGIFRYLQLISQISSERNDFNDVHLPDDPMLTVCLAASILQIPPYEKQPLLEAESSKAFISEVQRIYRREMSVLARLHQSDERPRERAAWLN